MSLQAVEWHCLLQEIRKDALPKASDSNADFLGHASPVSVHLAPDKPLLTTTIP